MVCSTRATEKRWESELGDRLMSNGTSILNFTLYLLIHLLNSRKPVASSFTNFNLSFNYLHLVNMSLEMQKVFALLHPFLAFIT